MNTEALARLTGNHAGPSSLPLTGRYPPDLLKKEIAKALAGLAICLAVLIALRPSPWIGWPVLAVGALFALYLLQQARRFPLRLRMDETGLTRERSGSGQAVPWSELRDLRLNFYPHGRKSALGTLVLVLKGGRARLKVDSTLDHFPTLLDRAAAAARERGLELHPTTQANLEKLGL